MTILNLSKSFIREINISLKKYEGASNNDEI